MVGGKHGKGYFHHPITEFGAWVVEEPGGGEGIPAAEMPSEYPGVRMIWPLVGASRDRVEEYRERAMEAVALGIPVKLVRFTGMTVVERHEPPAVARA